VGQAGHVEDLVGTLQLVGNDEGVCQWVGRGGVEETALYQRRPANLPGFKEKEPRRIAGVPGLLKFGPKDFLCVSKGEYALQLLGLAFSLGIDDKVIFEKVPAGLGGVLADAGDFIIDRIRLTGREKSVGLGSVLFSFAVPRLRQFDQVVDVVVASG
jgi:hypothetical protein